MAPKAAGVKKTKTGKKSSKIPGIKKPSGELGQGAAGRAGGCARWRRERERFVPSLPLTPLRPSPLLTRQAPTSTSGACTGPPPRLIGLCNARDWGRGWGRGRGRAGKRDAFFFCSREEAGSKGQARSQPFCAHGALKAVAHPPRSPPRRVEGWTGHAPGGVDGAVQGGRGRVVGAAKGGRGGVSFRGEELSESRRARSRTQKKTQPLFFTSPPDHAQQ